MKGRSRTRSNTRGADLQLSLAGPDLSDIFPHMAAIQLIVAVRLAATAQAIYGTLCVGLAIALLTSGLLYTRADGEAFLLLAALCLLALPICAGLRVHGDPAAA
jgi:hypothetical protein